MIPFHTHDYDASYIPAMPLISSALRHAIESSQSGCSDPSPRAKRASNSGKEQLYFRSNNVICRCRKARRSRPQFSKMVVEMPLSNGDGKFVSNIFVPLSRPDLRSPSKILLPVSHCFRVEVSLWGDHFPLRQRLLDVRHRRITQASQQSVIRGAFRFQLFWCVLQK